MPPPPPRQTLPAHIRPSMPSAGALNSNNARGASSIGGPGLGSQAGASGNHQALLTRLNEKTAELENLKELKELSAQMAGQMQALEEKLGTLGQGAEAVSLVLGNWAGVLRAVGMASAAVPTPKDGEDTEEEVSLPQALVRIPVGEMDEVRAKDAAE